jgi:ketosteroid isomerase-like protein
MSTTESVLDHHMEVFGEQDLDGTMEDYTDESVVISPQGVFRGREEIQGLFENIFAEFSQSGTTFSLDRQIVEGECAFIEWHAETPDNEYEFATDTFVIRDGTIATQTFTGVITPRD